MINIFFFSFLSSIYFLCSGIIFYKKYTSNYSYFFLSIIFGSVIISFLAVSLNFFFPLDKTINSLIFLIILVSGIFIIIKNKLVYYVIVSSILISLISTIILSYDNIYRPDASMYHLPYTKIINDSKIIFGISNIHFRFGHTSILQYLNANFYNHIFGEKGILMPAAIIFSSITLFFLNEVRENIYKDRIYSIFVFLLLSYILYGYNRYSEFGNDTIAHIIFLMLSTFLIKEKFVKNINEKEFFHLLLLSLFCFTLKTSLILVFLIPTYIFIMYFKKSYILNLYNILILSFFFIWFTKNLIVSGCLIYPIELTCFEQLKWLSNDVKFNISPKFQSLDNQAWSKGWSNYKGEKISREFYIKDFFWLKTWASIHGLLILKKLSVFFFLMCFLVFLFSRIEPKKFYIKKKINKEIFFLTFLATLGILTWFLRFPLFRYGSSYIVLFITIITTIFFIKFGLDEKNAIKLKKFINFFLITFLLLFTLKHIVRINKNIDNTKWPSFNSKNYLHPEFKSDPVFIKNDILYYRNKGGFGCGYTSSPCTPYEVNDIILTIKKGYKFYYLDIKK